LTERGQHILHSSCLRLFVRPEEDRHAVLVYLRHLKPIHHVTPEPVRGRAISIPGAIEQDYGGKDYGTSKAEHR
jgi:hypothetical protein